MSVMMLCVVCGWKRVVFERRKRKMTELEIMKRFAHERAQKTGVLLTCSCTLLAWRRVTTRMTALHVSHKRIIARHQHVIITSAFAAWTQRCKSKSLASLLHRKRQCNPVHFAVRTPLHYKLISSQQPPLNPRQCSTMHPCTLHLVTSASKVRSWLPTESLLRAAFKILRDVARRQSR